MIGLHTIEDFIFLSNLGHWIAGGILGMYALLTLAQVIGFLKPKVVLSVRAWFILTAGLISIFYIFLHHGLNQIGYIWQFLNLDPQQRQHAIMITLLTIAGGVEVVSQSRTLQNRYLPFVFPAVFGIIGMMFIFHPQHGTHEAITWAKHFHALLGFVLVIAGVLKGAEALWIQKQRTLAYVWIVFLSIASLMLVTYREPAGAYANFSLEQNPLLMKDH